MRLYLKSCKKRSLPSEITCSIPRKRGIGHSLKLQLRQQKGKGCPWPKQCKITGLCSRPLKHCQRNGSCRRRFKCAAARPQYRLQRKPNRDRKRVLGLAGNHRKVTSIIVKLACATVGIVILLIVLANGKSLLAFIVDKSSYLIAKVTGSPRGKCRTHYQNKSGSGSQNRNPANTSENSGNGSAPAPPSGRGPTAVLPPAPPDSGTSGGPEKSNLPEASPAANITEQPGEKTPRPRDHNPDLAFRKNL